MLHALKKSLAIGIVLTLLPLQFSTASMRRPSTADFSTQALADGAFWVLSPFFPKARANSRVVLKQAESNGHGNQPLVSRPDSLEWSERTRLAIQSLRREYAGICCLGPHADRLFHIGAFATFLRLELKKVEEEGGETTFLLKVIEAINSIGKPISETESLRTYLEKLAPRHGNHPEGWLDIDAREQIARLLILYHLIHNSIRHIQAEYESRGEAPQKDALEPVRLTASQLAAIMDSRYELVTGKPPASTFPFKDMWEELTKHLNHKIVWPVTVQRAKDPAILLKGNPLRLVSGIYKIIEFEVRSKSRTDADVQVKWRQQDSILVITIQGNGACINPELMEKDSKRGRLKLFDHHATEAWYAVKDAGGHIDVQSKPGEGTQYTISLPITQDRRSKPRFWTLAGAGLLALSAASVTVWLERSTFSLIAAWHAVTVLVLGCVFAVTLMSSTLRYSKKEKELISSLPPHLELGNEVWLADRKESAIVSRYLFHPTTSGLVIFLVLRFIDGEVAYRNPNNPDLQPLEMERVSSPAASIPVLPEPKAVPASNSSPTSRRDENSGHDIGQLRAQFLDFLQECGEYSVKPDKVFEGIEKMFPALIADVLMQLVEDIQGFPPTLAPELGRAIETFRRVLPLVRVQAAAPAAPTTDEPAPDTSERIAKERTPPFPGLAHPGSVPPRTESTVPPQPDPILAPAAPEPEPPSSPPSPSPAASLPATKEGLTSYILWLQQICADLIESMTQIPRNTPEQGEINKLKEQAIATKPILNGNGNSTDPLRNPELMKIMRALNPVIEAFRLAMTSAAKPEVIQASSVMNSLGELQRQIESLLASCLALTETPPASKDESHTQTSGAA